MKKRLTTNGVGDYCTIEDDECVIASAANKVLAVLVQHGLRVYEAKQSLKLAEKLLDVAPVHQKDIDEFIHFELAGNPRVEIPDGWDRVEAKLDKILLHFDYDKLMERCKQWADMAKIAAIAMQEKKIKELEGQIHEKTTGTVTA